MPQYPNSNSEAVEALLARPPHWLLRSGTGLIVCAFLLLIGFAAFIRYPDVVRGTAKISSMYPPVAIQGANGQIQVLEVGEGDTVKADQVLAVLSQDVSFGRVAVLRDWVRAAEATLSQGSLPSDPPRFAEPLGVLQAPYAVLLAAWDARRLQETYNLSAQDRAAANQRLALLGQRAQRLRGQDSLLREKFRIATERYLADSLLWTTGAASWFEVQEGRERMLTAQDAYVRGQAEVLDRDLLAAATTQDIARLGLEQTRSNSDLEGNLWRSLDGLRASIGQWEERHLLRAPFAGVLTFDLPPAIGQQLAAGQTFGWLMPLQAGARIARVRIPAAGAGKVERGQKVLVALADYPKAEFGVLEGEVQHVAPLLIDGAYNVDVALPADLVTRLGKRLTLRGEAIGQAEIVTAERSLLERVFREVVAAVE